MATMIDIVTRAYRKARLCPNNEALDADMASEGVEALNGMLHEWKLRGVDISHTTKADMDAFPLGPEYEDGTVYLLAERISPNYNRPRQFDADDFFRTMQAANLTIAAVTMPAALIHVPSRKARDGTLGFDA